MGHHPAIHKMDGGGQTDDAQAGEKSTASLVAEYQRCEATVKYGVDCSLSISFPLR